MEEAPITAARLTFLEGELLATQAAVRALILLSPNPQSAANAVAAQMEKLVSIALASAHTSDPQIQGMQTARKAVLPSARDIAGAGPAA